MNCIKEQMKIFEITRWSKWKFLCGFVAKQKKESRHRSIKP